MPSNWADTPGKEQAWKEAKDIFTKQADKEENEWGDSEWAQVMTIAKNIYANRESVEGNVITIEEEIQIGNYILEKGDKIKVLTEK